MTKRCELTDLYIDQCGHCQAPPEGINPTVYATKGGQAFHNDPKCEYLASGQNWAEEKGLNTHPINPIGWLNAMTNRSPCELCCLSFYEAKIRNNNDK